LFYPFHFNLGVQDADQEVAPAPGPREQEAESVPNPARNMVPARHSCSAEYWRPNYRSDGENNEDEASRGGRSSTLQRRGLFQRLRWPIDKGHARERSPRREHAESSRQGGSLACSLSPAPRRSRERSLDRLLRRFRRRDARREKRREAEPSPTPNCKLVPPASSGSSSPSGNRVAVPPPPPPLQDFIRGISTPAPQPILRTPAKNIKATKETQTPSVRQSGRLMWKALTKGGKTSEELAQELLCKKL
jgi:hypothetical protein